MACKDCYTGCGQIYSDKCVKYTGPEIPLLGICTGDSLYAFEIEVVNILQTIVNGTGIDLSDLTLDCAFVSTIQGTQEKNLLNILQTLVTAVCDLRELVKVIEDDIDTTFTYDFKCVTVPTNPSQGDIIQGVIDKLCALNTTLTQIQNTYVTQAGLCTAVQSCITTTNSTFNFRMVPYSILAYYGPLSNFDSSGKGLTANGFDKIYLCNGNNGTPDLRGTTLIGATAGVPGAAYPDTTNPSLTGINPDKGALIGTTSETLTVAQMPRHSHGIIDNGHTHKFPGQKYSPHPGGGSNLEYRDPADQETYNSKTGIALESTGNSQPHNNIQPSKAVHFIIYLP